MVFPEGRTARARGGIVLSAGVAVVSVLGTVFDLTNSSDSVPELFLGSSVLVSALCGVPAVCYTIGAGLFRGSGTRRRGLEGTLVALLPWTPLITYLSVAGSVFVAPVVLAAATSGYLVARPHFPVRPCESPANHHGWMDRLLRSHRRGLGRVSPSVTTGLSSQIPCRTRTTGVPEC